MPRFHGCFRFFGSKPKNRWQQACEAVERELGVLETNTSQFLNQTFDIESLSALNQTLNATLMSLTHLQEALLSAQQRADKGHGRELSDLKTQRNDLLTKVLGQTDVYLKLFIAAHLEHCTHDDWPACLPEDEKAFVQKCEEVYSHARLIARAFVNDYLGQLESLEDLNFKAQGLAQAASVFEKKPLPHDSSTLGDSEPMASTNDELLGGLRMC